jgi:hypothetical protein
MNYPSQEVHCVRSMLILNQGREQHDMGQWEEAQTRSRVMRIVHLHKVKRIFRVVLLRTLQETI